MVFYTADRGLLGKAIYERGSEDHSASLLTDYERAVATWTYANNKHAGASTRTLPEASCLYLAVRTGDEVFGVMGIALNGRELEDLSIQLFYPSSANALGARERQGSKNVKRPPF